MLTIEQGKPITESINEANGAADIIDWFAEEGRRCYPPPASRTSTLSLLQLAQPSVHLVRRSAEPAITGHRELFGSLRRRFGNRALVGDESNTLPFA